MKNQIYELKNKRATLIEDAQKALDAGKNDIYNTKMNEITALNAEIENHEKLQAEQGRFGNSDTYMQAMNQSIANQKQEQKLTSKLDDLRSGNEYMQAWAKAIAGGFNLKMGTNVESLKPLYNALTETGGVPVGTDGGFLVPVDFDNMLHEEMKQLLPLADLFTREKVTTLSGWRAIDNAPTKGFTKISEMATIPKDDQPKFKKIEYVVEPYALIVPVSNDLLDDSIVNLMRYLAGWFAKKSVITENIELLAALNTLTAVTLTSGKEIAGLKSVLNKNLDPLVAKNACLLTNQSGYDYLDQLEDANGRPLLQPDPTNATATLFKGRKIVMASDSVMPNVGTKAPVYIGDFKAFATIFDRKALEVASTNIGGDAWNTNSTEVRGIKRHGIVKMDEKTVVKCELALS